MMTISNCRWIAMAACLVGGAGHTQEIAPQPVEGNIRWVYRYDEGKEQALRTGKPMFVVFRCER